jgi:hypothetical protein
MTEQEHEKTKLVRDLRWKAYCYRREALEAELQALRLEGEGHREADLGNSRKQQETPRKQQETPRDEALPT